MSFPHGEFESPVPSVETDRPNPARFYDYGLGGDHNFAADREAFHRLLEVDPDAHLVVKSNRAFLRRAVRYGLNQGVRQFLDLGSGIPTVGHVHEAAHEIDPQARVVYVDNEPIAVAYTRRLLEGVDNAAMVEADLQEPDAILDAPETRQLLDLSQPVALLMAAVLHYVDDTDLAALMSRYRTVLAPGSYLVISHLTGDGDAQQMRQVQDIFDTSTHPLTLRTRREVSDLFDGFDIVDPGVVYVAEWRADPGAHVPNPQRSKSWGGVGYLRGR